MDHHHRSTLKQQNKKFKQGSNSSKRSIKRINKGKVNAKGGNGTVAESGSRADRVNAAKQAREEQRLQLMKARRGIAGNTPPPRLVILLPATRSAALAPVKRSILSQAADEMSDVGAKGPETSQLGKSGQRVTAIESPKDLLAFLDLTMVSDMLGLVVQDSEDQDAMSAHMVHAGKLYGLPTAVFVVVQGLQSKTTTQKKQSLNKWETALEKAVGREVKAFSESFDDVSAMLRFLANTKITERPSWQNHPLVLAHKVEAIAKEEEGAKGGAAGGGGEGESILSVSGYVRCAPLSVNQLCHIPAHGTFQISKMTIHVDPHAIAPRRGGGGGEGMGEAGEEVLADPEQQPSLEMEEEVDEMDAEQTWPTEDELKSARTTKKKLPAGMDDIQAAWWGEIDDEEEEEGEEGDEDEEGMEEEEGDEDEEEEGPEIEDEEDEDDAEMGDGEEEGGEEGDAFLKRRKEAKEDSEFPDEVDTPEGVAARVRFQKFRGLKSLRSSPWDPMENLPFQYAKISHFKNPNASRVRAIAEGKEGVAPGTYVTLHVIVPGTVASAVMKGRGEGDKESLVPLVVGGLLKYENKMSVMHYNVTRVKDDGDVVKSKENIVMVCGLRRAEVRPLYSEERLKSDKHKMLRYFPARGACVASCYAPTSWAPAPVLLLKRQKSGVLTLLAAGRVKGPDANRITLKRILLTGLPFKIHKRKATVRWMFFQPEDIRWFKPVELWSKEGRRGHIKEPLGTHGYMKCIFDASITYSDTICMSLYKRVFPPYPPHPALQLFSPPPPAPSTTSAATGGGGGQPLTAAGLNSK